MDKYPKQALAGVTPAHLSWIISNWQGHHQQEPIEEYWSPLVGGTLMGMYRKVKNGVAGTYAFLLIEQEDTHVLFRYKHFHPGMKGWEGEDVVKFLLVQLQPNKAVFWETTSPGRWMVYQLEPDDKLLIYFETEDKPLTAEEIFTYWRQKA